MYSAFVIWETLLMEMVERILLLQLESEMDEVPGAPPLDRKGRVYASCVRSSMTYGSETRPLLADVGLTFERADMQMTRWMCGVSMKDRGTSKELRKLVGVEPITTVIRSGRQRWYGHVMRKSYEDWVKAEDRLDNQERHG